MKIMLQQAVYQRGKTLYRLSLDLKIPLTSVYEWQRNNRMPRPEHLDAICNYLECGIEEILKPDRWDYFT